MFQIWWRSVQGFSVGLGSNFAILHWLWRSSVQHSHTSVWACDRRLSPTPTCRLSRGSNRDSASRMLLTGAAVFPGVKLRSNSNFLENSQVWYQTDQKIYKLCWIKIWHLLLLNVVKRCTNWKVTLRHDPSGVKLRSNSNFSENSQVRYQIDQKIILNKDVVFSFALCGQAL